MNGWCRAWGVGGASAGESGGAGGRESAGAGDRRGGGWKMEDGWGLGLGALAEGTCGPPERRWPAGSGGGQPPAGGEAAAARKVLVFHFLLCFGADYFVLV